MKKLIYIFTILSSLLVFNTIYTECSKDQYVKLNNLPEAIAYENDQEVYTISYNIGNNSKEIKTRYRELYKFAKKNNYGLVINKQEQNGFLVNNIWYTYTTNNIKKSDFLKTKNNKMIQFSKPSDDYLTSSQNDKIAYDQLQFINQKYGRSYQDKIIIKQYASLLNDIDINSEKGMSITVFLFSKNIKDISSSILDSDISEYVVPLEDRPVYEGVTFTEIDHSFSLLVIVLTIMATVILLVCQIFKLKKDIVIRRMFGQNSLYIFNKMFLNQLVTCVFLYIVLQFIAYGIVIGNLNTVNIVLLKECILIFIYYIGFILLTCMCVIVAIRSSRSYESMKKSGNIFMVSYGSLLLKMVFVIMVISPFVGSLFLLKDVAKETYTLYTSKDTMNGYIVVNGIKENHYDTKDLILDFFNKNNAIYQDFGKNFENELNKEFSTQGYTVEMPYPYIIVNKEYLKNYQIRTTDGKDILTDKLKSNTLLIPEMYKDKDMSAYCSNCSDIVIKNGYSFVSHNAFTYDNYSMLKKKNPIIYVVEKGENWNGNYLFLKNTSVNARKLEKYFEDNNLENIITIGDNNKNYHMAVEENHDNLINIVIIFGIYIALTLVFQFQSIYIYFSEHKNLFAINYLLGKNFLQRYSEIFILNILVYVIPFIYGVMKTELTMFRLSTFIIGAMLIDSVIAYYMIRYFEKRNIIKILKGDN